MEEGAVAEAVAHVLQVLVVQLDDGADILLGVGVALVLCRLACERSKAVTRGKLQ